MEFRQRPLGFMEFLQNNNHQAVNKMKKNFNFVNCLMIAVLKKLHETQGSQSKFHGINYIYLIYIYYYYYLLL